MAPKQFERLQIMGKNVTNSGFYKMLAKNNSTKNEAAQIIKEEILPSYEILSNYIFGEYYKHLRPGPGIESLTNLKGDEFYEANLEFYTTQSNVDPKEIHQFGYECLKKSQERFKEIVVKMGYVNESATFMESLNAITSNKRLE